jgi:hypothetical protein
MQKRIEFFLLSSIILTLLIALGVPFVVLETTLQDNTQYAAYLQYQHLCGWVISFFGITFIALHTFVSKQGLSYEILDAGRLVRMMLLLLFLSVAYLSISQPFPYNGREPWVPMTQFIITAASVLLTTLMVITAIKRTQSPRMLLILLIMYHLYFTNAIVLMALIERNHSASFAEIFQMLQHSLLWILTSATVLITVTGLVALKKRHSVLDQIFIEMKMLTKIKDKAKQKEDKIKQNPLTPELAEALKVLTTVLAPKPTPEDRLKNSLSEALEKFAHEVGKNQEVGTLETRLKAIESAVISITTPTSSTDNMPQ